MAFGSSQYCWYSRVTRDRLLLVLPADQSEADWVIDHMITKFVSTSSARHEKPDRNGSAVACENAGPQDHKTCTCGKLKVQSSQFARSDTDPTAEESDASDDAYRSSDDSSQDEEWDEMKKQHWIKLPFELQCADSILFCVNEMNQQDTTELVEASTQYIDFIMQDRNLGDDHSRIVRAMKDGRKALASRVKSFCASLTRILNEGSSFGPYQCAWDVSFLRTARSVFLYQTRIWRS